ncbi:hypothetical protein ZWY2020_010157 [Hordeum vulgare]|nr:hypothetical protein ZWY2020_010157 [Hordeum vulgare]
MTPQLPAALELLPRGAPAFADELEATRCRTLLSLSFARASDQGEPSRAPAEARRPRDGPAPHGRCEKPPAPMVMPPFRQCRMARHLPRGAREESLLHGRGGPPRALEPARGYRFWSPLKFS